MPAAGRLNERVTIEKATLGTADTRGEQLETWSDVATVWAEVRTLGGIETWKQRTVSASATHQVTIRWRSGVTSANRFKWDSSTLAIESVVADPSGTQLVCLCREKL